MVKVQKMMPSDSKSEDIQSFARQGTVFGDKVFCRWNGFAEITPGSSYASLNILTPSQQKTVNNKTKLTLPAGATITSCGFRPLNNVVLNASGDKLKLAVAQTSEDSASYVALSSAVTGDKVLVSSSSFYSTKVGLNEATKPTVASADSEVTFQVFAVDGNSDASANASTLTASSDTKVLVSVGFYVPNDFPTENDIGYKAPEVIS